MNKFFAILCLTLLPVLGFAQQGEKVKCIVVDGKTYKPIKYVVATIGDLKDTTGRNGVFIIYLHGPRKVMLEAPGYESKEVVVQPGAAKNKQYLKMYKERRKHEILN